MRWSNVSPARRYSSACATCRRSPKIVLDNESKERVLVGEVISTVALAGQISREKTVSDHGIDMEIEFKDDVYEATRTECFICNSSAAIPIYGELKATARRFSGLRTCATPATGWRRRFRCCW